MNKKTLLVGAALAGLTLGVTSCASNSNVAKSTVGKCHGVNSCKGTGACGGDGNSCAGKNSCKGHGFEKMSKGECDTKGGKFETM